jgi:hypothetical protein
MRTLPVFKRTEECPYLAVLAMALGVNVSDTGSKISVVAVCPTLSIPPANNILASKRIVAVWPALV